jgi:D-proline reductase (dithiol) PrdB
MALNYLPILGRRAAPNPPRELKRITNPAWCRLSVPLNEMRVALITTGAIREESQRPFPYMGDASYRRIDSDPAVSGLHVDHRSPFGNAARKDSETVFPRKALRALTNQGLIRSVAPFHLSIYGGIRLYRAIEEKLAPALTHQLEQGRVDLAVFVPY